MFPLITALLPALISVAEKVFTSDKTAADGSKVSKGSLKKAMVMKALEGIWDSSGSKILPDFPNVDEKRLFLRTAEVWIEELVPQLTA